MDQFAQIEGLKRRLQLVKVSLASSALMLDGLISEVDRFVPGLYSPCFCGVSKDPHPFGMPDICAAGREARERAR